MTDTLWTDVYAPSLSELPQDDVRDYLEDATEEPINLMFHGGPGVGKTAAVRALAQEAHESPDHDLVELNVADVFGMTKKEISNDPRFRNFIDNKRKRNSSKTDLINHVLKESASYSPMSGEYKTILLDNAEAIREDFQQALRRVMEQYYESTQFIITTRQPSKLIPPLKSRCFPIAFDNPTVTAITDILEENAAAEDIEYDTEALEYIAGYADGNIRKAIMSAQTVAETEDSLSLEAAHTVLGDVGVQSEIETMLDNAEDGAFSDARSILDDLLVDEGYSGEELLEEILTAAHTGRYEGAELANFVTAAGDLDVALNDGNSDRIQLSQLLADLGNNTTNQTI